MPSSRRALLRAVAAGVTGSLAGCAFRSRDDTGSDGSTTATRTTTGATPSSAASGSESTTTARESPPTEAPQSETDTVETTETYAGTGGPPPTTTTPTDPTPLSVSGSWPGFQFDAGNTGASRDVTATPDGEVYWSLFTRGSSPAVADGTLYLPEFTEDRLLVARGARTGAVEWTASIPHGQVGQAPLVLDEQVVVLSYGMAHGFDREEGRERWTYDLGRGAPTAPVTDGDGVFFCNGSFTDWPAKAFALEADGSERWTVEFDGVDVEGSLAYGQSEGAVYVPLADTASGAVVALDASDGSERWRAETDDAVVTATAVRDGQVYAADASGTVYALAAADGGKQWTAGVGDPTDGSGLAVTDTTVYVGGNDGLSAFSVENGNERWTAPAEATVHTPTVDAGTVYYGSSDRFLRAVDADTGDLQWTFETDQKRIADYTVSGVTAPPVPVEGGLFVVAADGLYAFGPQ